jgi:diguanylate cyclase (GGDEF)-like protein
MTADGHPLVARHHLVTLTATAAFAAGVLVNQPMSTVGISGGPAADAVLAVLTGIAGILGYATLRNRGRLRTLRADLARLPTVDALTGLANRAGLFGALDDPAGAALLALAVIDLDGFRKLNDTHGHETADAVLVAVADRLGRLAGPTALVARTAGDTFVVVDRPVEREAARALGERLASCFLTPVLPAGRNGRGPLSVRASIGVAVADVGNLAPRTLLDLAEECCGEAKGGGGGRVVLRHADLGPDRRAGGATELRAALERGEFELRYQPIVDLATSQICEVEALLRWRHPTLGLLGPSAFLDRLERSALIGPVGEWVVEAACGASARWRRVLPADSVPVVAVNVSPTQLAADDFVDLLTRALRRHGLPPTAIRLEITEGALISDAPAAHRLLAEIDELGIPMSLDDFGTGYSSLTFLRTLPVDAVKIDMSFVRGMLTQVGDRAIVTGVIGMARSLGMACVAEGVESDEQLALLADLGCTHVQGYHVGGPMPADDVVARVGARVR